MVICKNANGNLPPVKSPSWRSFRDFLFGTTLLVTLLLRKNAIPVAKTEFRN